MRRITTLLVIFLFTQPAYASIKLIDQRHALQRDSYRLIDARSLDTCVEAGVKSALCLPAASFTSDSAYLPSFYHSNWLLGTLGLDGSETVLVFSDNAAERNLVAGMMYLAGQQAVTIWSGKIEALQRVFGAGKGVPRGMIRKSVFSGEVRDDQIALIEDLDALAADGWQIFPADNIPTTQSRKIVADLNPSDAINAFATLLAGGLDAKVVIDSHAVRKAPAPGTGQALGLVLILLGAGALMFVFYTGRMK